MERRLNPFALDVPFVGLQLKLLRAKLWRKWHASILSLDKESATEPKLQFTLQDSVYINNLSSSNTVLKLEFSMHLTLSIEVKCYVL